MYFSSDHSPGFSPGSGHFIGIEVVDALRL